MPRRAADRDTSNGAVLEARRDALGSDRGVDPQRAVVEPRASVGYETL